MVCAPKWLSPSFCMPMSMPRKAFAGMLGTFATFCAEQGITTVENSTAPLVCQFF